MVRASIAPTVRWALSGALCALLVDPHHRLWGGITLRMGEQARRSQANLTEVWLIKAELEWNLCRRPETTVHALCCSSPSSFSAASLVSALEKGRVLCVRSTKKIFVKHAWMSLMHFYSWETHIPHFLSNDPRARNGPLGRYYSSRLKSKGFHRWYVKENHQEKLRKSIITTELIASNIKWTPSSFFPY